MCVEALITINHDVNMLTPTDRGELETGAMYSTHPQTHMHAYRDIKFNKCIFFLNEKINIT